ncbi:MAG: glycoside hydrolase family 127 protein, partial [Halanaerobiaceae bacterium]
MVDKGVIASTENSCFKIKNTALSDVRWTRGFWKDRMDICHENSIYDMWKIIKEPGISHIYNNFLIAAGLEEGEHQGPGWNDGDFYKWMEAAIVVYAQTEDKELVKLLDVIIDVLDKTQREDGYIHTPVLIKQQNGEKVEEFNSDMDFETYNMGHLMTTACIHHRVTGKENLLDIACQAADYLWKVFNNDPQILAENALCPAHYMGVIELYRTTGKSRYLDLGINLLEIRDLIDEGTDHNQDRIPFRKQQKAVGHAVRANYLYAGVADIYAETGDESLLSSLKRIWEDVVSTKMYITGACGALYDGVSPDGTSYNPQEIQQVHQAYGRPYQLPSITAHNESCATIGSILWNWRMFKLQPQAKFMDIIERTLYNGLLAATDLDGQKYLYTNPLRVARDLPFDLRWSDQRKKFIECYCCPPNIVRTIAEVNNMVYSISENGIWINLYGGSVLETELTDGSKIKLKQETDYPWSGEIKILVITAPPEEISLNLRIPDWAQNVSIAVNGKKVDKSPESGKYFRINKKWSQGDLIELN